MTGLAILFWCLLPVGLVDQSEAPEKKWLPPNFIRELRYTCYPEKTQDLIAYFTRLAEADLKVQSGRMRWMDGQPYGQLVIAGIPAYRLEEYDTRPSSGKKAEFEQVWLRALEAYRKVAPSIILTVAETIAGGGPDYVIARPLKSYAEYEKDLAPEEVVRKAFGKADGDAFSRNLTESVGKWETFIFDRTNLDTNTQ